MDFDKSVGPQVSFDKSYLCMMTDDCKIKQDQGKYFNRLNHIKFEFLFKI